MDFNEYQEGASRTANRTDVDTVEKRLANFGLGLSGEAGETADIIKKHLFHGQDLDKDKIKRELGDVLWYIAAICFTLGFSMEEIASLNIAKLKARYPEGFSVERSTIREGEAR